MEITMKHEKHGRTTAYNNNDVAYLESLGWEKETPIVKIEVREEDQQDLEVAKRGRPRKG